MSRLSSLLKQKDYVGKTNISNNLTEGIAIGCYKLLVKDNDHQRKSC
ncbi:hypothetical protein JEZ13_09630 [bacterium]|nr:hypothetical protein [bacterium]